MNLAQFFNSQRRLIAFDVESTGLDVDNDRIIELAFRVHHPDGRIDVWRSLIQPGVPVPYAATETHGITEPRLAACRKCAGPWTAHADVMGADITPCGPFEAWPTFKQLAPKLAAGFSDVDFAGKNLARFDLPILGAEFARAGVAWSVRGARIIDLDKLEQLAEPRNLRDLYKRRTGKELADAHSALPDIEATEELIIYDLEHFPLERDLDKLHEAQFAGMIDLRGRFRMREGLPHIMFGKYVGKSMAEISRIDPGYWKWMAGPKCTNVSPEVKAIAAAAVRGGYPK